VTSDIINSSFGWTEDQTIIHINEYDTVLSDKETFVDSALMEANADKIFCQMVVPIVTGLF
jgi:hypothetical protein